MKAGLQQIPIQGAAPRLAGNREWDGLPMPTRFWAILAVAFGVSLSVIDGAIANVALPTMARMLGISSANSIWIVNAYQLAIVVSLLSFSALGDVIGYRKIYIGGLGIFIVASLGCTLSDSLATLVTARVCQGFGAAAITSVNTTLIRLIYPRRHLGRGMGVNATVVAVSSVAGPTLASGILSIATWPWLFAINIPIGLIACLLSYRFLPKNPVRIRGRHFDWRDGLMNALTFGLLIASIEGYSHGLKPSYIGISVILLVVIGTLFVRSQLHKPYPILPFDLLRIPIFSVSVLTSICSFLGQMLAMVALPFYLQHEFGYDEVATGLLMTAWPAVIMVVAPVAGLLVERVHAGLLGGMGVLNGAAHLAQRLARRAGRFPACAAISVVCSMVFCNQSTCAVVCNQLLEDDYTKRGHGRGEMALDIENSGIVLSPLIPWNISVSIPLAMLGADMSAIPYEILLYAIPLCYWLTKRRVYPPKGDDCYDTIAEPLVHS